MYAPSKTDLSVKALVADGVSSSRDSSQQTGTFARRPTWIAARRRLGSKACIAGGYSIAACNREPMLRRAALDGLACAALPAARLAPARRVPETKRAHSKRRVFAAVGGAARSGAVGATGAGSSPGTAAHPKSRSGSSTVAEGTGAQGAGAQAAALNTGSGTVSADCRAASAGHRAGAPISTRARHRTNCWPAARRAALRVRELSRLRAAEAPSITAHPTESHGGAVVGLPCRAPKGTG
uniref:Uncharacterized protein n=1 Tax=Alexandrium catenella TaxID=2925 RepID=A0A7S1LGL5_ALECA|mmetsp:Transcript_11323/g.30892  ORF Transcript_11323/g.30892 Transcript_11323/m.30892 type:complete len:239 (+) Transcript_11323:467-1183(+)